MNRREFLKAAGLGAAGAAVMGFPTIVRASALGRDGHVAPSERIVMAAIGIGWMGTSNLNSFLSKDEVQMVAICDVDTEHRNEGKRLVNDRYKNDSCRTYIDLYEMFAKENLDAVTMALPDFWHAVAAVTAMKNGLDVYGEKPIAHTVAEGRAIADAAKRYGRVWQTGSWQRSTENFHRACELVRNGRVGKVTRVEVGLPGGQTDFAGTKDKTAPEPVPAGLDYERWMGPSPVAPYCPARLHKNWRWMLDLGGGMLLDWVGHHVDIAHWGLGKDYDGPVEVDGNATWGNGYWDAPVEYEVKYTYADGLQMTVSSNLPGGTRWFGDKGSVHVNRGSLEADPASVLEEVIGPEEIHLQKSTDHWQNFLDCVRSRQLTLTPAEVAHRSASVGHIGMISMRLGRKLRWDPKAERFVNDPEADRMLGNAMRSPYVL